MKSETLRLEKAIQFTRRSVYLAYSWPPPPNSTKWQNKKFNILWAMSFISSLALLAPLLASIYVFQGDTLIVTKSTIFVFAVSNFAIKMIVCRVHRKKIQVLISEMMDFVNLASPKERAILECYMDKCSGFHATITIMYYMTAACIICGPLILPQPFPTNAIYPFPVSSPLVKFAIYIHQGFVGFQCSTGLTLDFQSAVLLWYSGARLELLAKEAQMIENKREFRTFIKKHQHLLWYAGEVRTVIRYVSLTTAAMTGIATAFGLLQLISNQPLLVKLQFATVVISSGINLYTCAWPADNLTSVCRLVGAGIYSSPWFRMPAKLLKDYNFVLHMSQKPVVISIGGFIPVLSLQYYGSERNERVGRKPATETITGR
nr:olfactory receptor 60 [Gregopimpla kuwanae]